MPLPGLRQTADWHAIDFREVAAIPSTVLSRRSRVAACSRQGILLLQQRFAFHLTRLAVPLANLHEVSLPVFTESELLTDWGEAALDATWSADDEATVAEAEVAFHAYLDEDGQRRRNRLQQAHLHADLRRECRREIASRYPLESTDPT